MRVAGLATLYVCLATAALAQAPKAEQPRQAYDKLEMFVGTWTTEGSEKTFSETCEWFDGRFHVVCRAERKRADGTTGRSLSIIGYLPAENTYTHYGIGSRGGNDTLRGSHEGGSFVFHGESRDGGKRVSSRVTITPDAAGSFALRAESSTDGGSWVEDGTIKYKRLR